MMTRKHFEAIAAAVKEVMDDTAVRQNDDRLFGAHILANKLADVCAGSNGRFDKGRFLRACGV